MDSTFPQFEDSRERLLEVNGRAICYLRICLMKAS